VWCRTLSVHSLKTPTCDSLIRARRCRRRSVDDESAATCLAARRDADADGMPRPELRALRQHDRRLWMRRRGAVAGSKDGGVRRLVPTRPRRTFRFGPTGRMEPAGRDETISHPASRSIAFGWAPFSFVARACPRERTPSRPRKAPSRRQRRSPAGQPRPCAKMAGWLSN
jgi:hypothetical protein